MLPTCRDLLEQIFEVEQEIVKKTEHIFKKSREHALHPPFCVVEDTSTTEVF